jgi:hypothetical protein
MRKVTAAIFVLLFIISCKDHKKLSEQLNDTFANHIKQIDSLVVLDSIHILYNAPLTEMLARIIDDSGYSIQIRNVQAQLLSAKEKNKKDSIEIYQYELDYLGKVFDSVAKSISHGDTTRIFGRMIGVAYFITKNRKTKIDSTVVFIDSVSHMINTPMMDLSLKRNINTLN